jgi:hypothetical protein
MCISMHSQLHSRAVQLCTVSVMTLHITKALSTVGNCRHIIAHTGLLMLGGWPEAALLQREHTHQTVLASLQNASNMPSAVESKGHVC